MEIPSKYTKTFVSNSLTELKYNELLGIAVFIREQKNKISEYVNDNLWHYLEYSPLNFVTEMRSLYKGVMNSNFDKQAYQQVFDCYANKFDAIQKSIKFEHREFVCFEHYKKKVKNHNKGDFKKVLYKVKSTPLSTCLTYLARYGNDNTVEFIKKQLENKDLEENKRKFYNNILERIDKFGFARLMNLALKKRQRIISKYVKQPIEFKSLTFSGRSRKKCIIEYNKNYNSKINSFISLSVPTRKSMDIPVKFSKEYHGRMKDYKKSTNDYEYNLVFNELKKQVKINIAIDGHRYIPDVTIADKVVSIDVNVKHNLFSLSNGTTYDYDRDIVREYCKCKLGIDRLKSIVPNYNVGKRKQHKFDVLKNKYIKHTEQIIANMCKSLQKQGFRHIVMEDLTNGFGKSKVKFDEFEGINFNDLVHFLNISSMKQMTEHIARNYDIGVSTVQSCYTSKMCPICGCIEDENRPNQETFECIECGHLSNADFNASINIRNRVVEAVLRDKLLSKLDNGTYKPKKLKREKVKEILLSYRSNV